MSEPTSVPRLLLPALAVALGYHVAMQFFWVTADQGDSSGVCCDMVGYVIDAGRWLRNAEAWWRDALAWPVWTGSGAAALGQGQRFVVELWNQLVWNPRAGWLQLVAALLFSVTRSEEFGFVLATACVTLTQLALCGLGWRLSGPWAGALAAALYPLMPAVAWLERRVDVYAASACVATLGALALVRTASLSRGRAMLAFVGLAVAATCMSPRPTDNLLLLMAMLGMAGLAGLRGLTLGRGALGEPAPRLRVLGFGLLALAAVGLVASWILNSSVGQQLSYLDYVRSEAGDAHYSARYARLDPIALTAYARHLIELAWTRWNAVGLALGGALWLLRGRGRAELLGWALLPLVVLSLLSKKNPYYIYMIFPALSLVTALGVAALPLRGLRWLVGAAALLLAGAQHFARSAPALVADTPLASVQWTRAWSSEDQAFQSPNWEFELAPRPPPGNSAFAEKVVDALPVEPCACNYLLVAGGNVQWGEISVPLAMRSPCARMVFWPVPQATDDIGVLLVGERGGPAHQDESNRLIAIRSLAALKFTLVEQSVMPDGTFEIWRRDDAWFDSYCARHGRPR